MIIIHAMNDLQAVPRQLEGPLEKALATSPVVVVSGARQTGKSTLASRLDDAKRREYLTLDDPELLERARSAPDALVTGAKRVTIDEVQRSPELLLAIKRSVDRERTRGRFLLTGSADLLLMKRVSESLAGRAAVLRLLPLTWREAAREAGRPLPWEGGRPASRATTGRSSMLVNPESRTASMPCQTKAGIRIRAGLSSCTSARPCLIRASRKDAAFSSGVSPRTVSSTPDSILALRRTMSM